MEFFDILLFEIVIIDESKNVLKFHQQIWPANLDGGMDAQ